MPSNTKWTPPQATPLSVTISEPSSFSEIFSQDGIWLTITILVLVMLPMEALPAAAEVASNSVVTLSIGSRAGIEGGVCTLVIVFSALWTWGEGEMREMGGVREIREQKIELLCIVTVNTAFHRSNAALK